jgi:ribosome biogenesis GTPase
MQNKEAIGTVVRLTGGFYTVDTPEGLFSTRARGLFRLSGVSPCVGDKATVEITGPGEGYLVDIAPRKNVLIRPPVANLDQLMVVVAAAQPGPNYRVIDKLITLAEYRSIPVTMVITKTDLGDGSAIANLYTQAGYPVILCDGQYMDEALRQRFAQALAGKLTALCGNTGVGKSSLLNRLRPELNLPTGEISKSLGRGRHTTRHVELFSVLGGLVADTPGFSAIEIEKLERITKEELPLCFREFRPFVGRCRFDDCAHEREPDCAVRAAVEDGRIAQSRYDSYLALLEEARRIKSWEK